MYYYWVYFSYNIFTTISYNKAARLGANEQQQQQLNTCYESLTVADSNIISSAYNMTRIIYSLQVQPFSSCVKPISYLWCVSETNALTLIGSIPWAIYSDWNFWKTFYNRCRGMYMDCSAPFWLTHCTHFKQAVLPEELRYDIPLESAWHGQHRSISMISAPKRALRYLLLL